MIVATRLTLRVLSRAAVLAVFVVLTGCATPPAATLNGWIVSDARPLGFDSQPAPENEVYSSGARTARLTAAINETVAFQLALRRDGPAPAGPYDVVLSDLTGPNGILPANQAALFRIHAVRVTTFRSWYPEHTGRSATPIEVPDVLVPWNAPRGGGPLSFEGAGNQLVWIDLHVPLGTPPGEYIGRIDVLGPPAETRPFTTPTRVRAFSSELRLTVAPVAIPSERSLPVLCRVDPRDLLETHLRWPTDTAENTKILPEAPSHQAAQHLIDAAIAMLHEHRAAPILWADFPNYRVTGERSVEIDWSTYDPLIAGWLDGAAMPDRVGLPLWPAPASAAYPDAERNGGFASPRYARILAAYLAECDKHFKERGWRERGFLRLLPPSPPTVEIVEQLQRIAGILRQSETAWPLVAHLPMRTLRTLGWHGAATVELPNVDTWAPPAQWWEPEMAARQRGLGQRVWFMPDEPPYAPSLAVEGPAADPVAIAWQAFRYGADGVWLENVAQIGRPRGEGGKPLAPRAADALFYPGTDYGLAETPLPSIRLKRLRRGLYDHEMLGLLERSGRSLLAKRTAEQLVHWGFTDACEENLLSCRASGWATDPYAYWLARKVLLQELTNAFAPSEAGSDSQISNLADWARLLVQTAKARIEARGVRLDSGERDMRARIFLNASNTRDEPLIGRWTIHDPPAGWRPLDSAPERIAPGGRGSAVLEAVVSSLAYNTSGVYPLRVQLQTDAGGTLEADARLAVAACPLVETPPVVDGELSDWRMASNNAAGDFLLVRGEGGPPDSGARAPVLPTQAFFCMDERYFYVGMHCVLKRDEPPLWSNDNVIPIDGAVPWGQDVVELLLSPRPAPASAVGSGGELYVLQIKPSGLLMARKGALTDPPMNASEPWQSEARAAVKIGPEAWDVEIALPLASLDRAALRSRVWGLNLTRLDARRGEYSSWSGARRQCYAPERLGNLVLERP